MKEKTDGSKPASKPKRARNFATLVYPESAPNGWQEILGEKHIPAFISPLHDRDKKADGTTKKAHYHVLLMFSGNKSQGQVQEIINEIGGVGLMVVESLPAQARYLTHLDNPDKAQYSENDVISLGGANYSAITHLASDDIGMIREMLQFIRANQITSFTAFTDYCADKNEKWLTILVIKHQSYFFKEYIKSLSWLLMTGKEKANEETEPEEIIYLDNGQ